MNDSTKYFSRFSDQVREVGVFYFNGTEKMKTKILKISTLLIVTSTLTGCEYADYVESKAKKINNYERVALTLSKENRKLQADISKLEFEIQSLKSRNAYLELKLEEKNKKTQRTIASVAPVLPKNNEVKFDVYKWTPEQMLSTAEKEFEQKNFEKSAQFFHSMAHNYKNHKLINDKFYFQAGVAAYESGKHDDWTIYHMTKLIENYPTSQFYRGAKLWMAMTHLKQGHKEKFFNTVEEFRKKYKNTKEWDILKGHYEEIVQKYKQN
jgi:TolA-binding protein